MDPSFRFKDVLQAGILVFLDVGSLSEVPVGSRWRHSLENRVTWPHGCDAAAPWLLQGVVSGLSRIAGAEAGMDRSCSSMLLAAI